MLKNYWKFQNRSVQIFGLVYHDTNGLNHGPVLEDPVVLLERNLYGHSFGRTNCGKGNLRKILLKARLGKSFKLGMHSRTPWKRIILICVCGWQKIGWKDNNLDPIWKVLNKEVDLGEPTSFLGSCILGLHSKEMPNKKRYCGQLQNHVRISNSSEKRKTTIPSKSSYFFMVFCDMEGHAKKCVERYCELANKTTQQLYKVSTPCIDDHHFTEEELKSVRELSNTCSQNVL